MEYPTAFEELIAELKIPEAYWSEHPEVRRFVTKNRNSRYVPESLLRQMNVVVDANMSDWQSLDYHRERSEKKRTSSWRSTMVNYFHKGA